MGHVATRLVMTLFIATVEHVHGIPTWSSEEADERSVLAGRAKENMKNKASTVIHDLNLDRDVRIISRFRVQDNNEVVIGLELEFDTTLVDEEHIDQLLDLIRKPIRDAHKTLKCANEKLGDKAQYATIHSKDHISIDEAQSIIFMPPDAHKLFLKLRGKNSATLRVDFDGAETIHMEIPAEPPPHIETDNPQHINRAWVDAVIDHERRCMIMLEDSRRIINLSYDPEDRDTLLLAQINNSPVSVEYEPTFKNRKAKKDGGTLLKVSLHEAPTKGSQLELFDLENEKDS